MEIRELLERVLRREKEAWDTLVGRFSPLVWGVLGKFESLSRSEREELCQDVFVVLLERGLSSFRGQGEHEFRLYLRTIAENEAKSLLRRQGRKLEVLDPFLPGEEEEEEGGGVFLPNPGPGPEEEVAGREEWEKVRLCLGELSLEDQEIFWMRARGYAYEEMVEMLGLPLGTLASRYHRAREKVRECLRRAGVLEGKKGEEGES